MPPEVQNSSQKEAKIAEGAAIEASAAVRATAVDRAAPKKTAEALNVVEAGGIAVINAALMAEIAENLAAESAGYIAGGLTLVLDWIGVGVAGRQAIKRVKEKIKRRIKRIEYLAALNDREDLKIDPQKKWEEILKYTKSDRREAVTTRVATSDFLPAALSGATVGVSVLGFMANPLRIITRGLQIIARGTETAASLIIGGAIGIFEGIVAWFKGRAEEKLQNCAQQLKDIENDLLREAYQAAHQGALVPASSASDDEIFVDFDAEFKILQDHDTGIKKEIAALPLTLTRKERKKQMHELAQFQVGDKGIAKTISSAENLKWDKAGAGVIAGITTLVTGAASCAIVSLLFFAGTAAVLAFPPIILVWIAVAAVAVGVIAYKAVAGKLITAAHHCANKLRALFGLAPIDGKQSGLSASAVITLVGSFLGILSLLTFPIVGLMVAGIVGGCLATIHFIAAWRLSAREAKRKNLVKRAKYATCGTKDEKGKDGTELMIVRSIRSAPQPKFPLQLSVSSDLFSEHCAAKKAAEEGKSEKTVGLTARQGFFKTLHGAKIEATTIPDCRTVMGY